MKPHMVLSQQASVRREQRLPLGTLTKIFTCLESIHTPPGNILVTTTMLGALIECQLYVSLD